MTSALGTFSSEVEDNFKIDIHGQEDGGGIGWGDHFLPYKFIERTFEC